MEFVVAASIVVLGLAIVFYVRNKREDEFFDSVKNKAEQCPDCHTNHPTMTPHLAKRFLETMCGATRSYKKGDYLTKFELHWLQWRLSHGFPTCIDCEEGDFERGPMAGTAMNVRCNNKRCGSVLNLFSDMSVSRVTNQSPDKPLEMVQTGPLR